MTVGTAVNPTSKVQPSTPFIRQEFQLVICALGIYICYLRYGLLQEKIYSASYGENNERFVYSAFLVAVQTATNSLVAFLVILFSRFSTKQTDNKSASTSIFKNIPIKDYAIVALSYLSAMIFSFTALNHMSYPMQALGKSCKMIPVMIMGIVIRKRRYKPREFFCVALVTMGVAMFSWKSKKSTVPSSPLGFALLFASLFMDGVTGPMQERLVAKFKPSTHQLMFWQNLCSVGWLTILLAVTGEGFKAIAFVLRHPLVMNDIMLFSLVSALGQNFIFYTVRNFNALIVTTITTTRKMFTVLLSIFAYNHAMVPRQWLGLGLVFTAIVWEAVAKQQAKKATTKVTSKKDE